MPDVGCPVRNTYADGELPPSPMDLEPLPNPEPLLGASTDL